MPTSGIVSNPSGAMIRIESNTAARAAGTPGVYHTNDEVGNSVAAPTIFFTWNNIARAIGGRCIIMGIEFSTNSAACLDLYDLWLYNAIPTNMQGDHVAFQNKAADRVARQGVIEGIRPVAQAAGSDCAYGEVKKVFMPFFCASTSNVAYGRLKVASAGAGAPISAQTFNAALLVLRNW